MKFILRLLPCLTLLLIGPVAAGPYYQTGKIKDLTVTSNGILVTFNPDFPDNCEGTAHGWALVKEEDTALTAAILALRMSERLSGTIYTKGLVDGKGSCTVNQFHPAKR